MDGREREQEGAGREKGDAGRQHGLKGGPCSPRKPCPATVSAWLPKLRRHPGSLSDTGHRDTVPPANRGALGTHAPRHGLDMGSPTQGKAPPGPLCQVLTWHPMNIFKKAHCVSWLYWTRPRSSWELLSHRKQRKGSWGVQEGRGQALSSVPRCWDKGQLCPQRLPRAPPADAMRWKHRRERTKPHRHQ